MVLTGLLLTIAAVWALAYWGAGTATWLTAFVVGLAAVTLGTHIHWYVSLPLWLTVTAVVLLLGVPRMRHRFISGPLLRQFRRVMPGMSRTEREALQAGSVWWDAELFSGNPHWGRLLRLPRPYLSSEEQAFLNGPTETLCRLLVDWRITHHDQDLSAEAWEFIRREGFFGLIIPRRFGGKGFSAQAHSEVVMKLASRSVAGAVTVMVPNSLGPGKLLMSYGTPEQQQYYLPRLARGDEIPCFALTSPDAGSDAGAIPDQGVVCMGEWQGKQALGVRLNWDKRYITLGPVCTLLGLAFRLYDPDHLLGEREDLGITLALVPRDTPGVKIGARHIPLDIPFQNGPNSGRDVFVPLTQLVGGREGIGRGWRMLVECLSEGRGISLPSLSVGAAKLACRHTGAYAAIRQQFGLPIGRFEGIEKPLARIAGLTYQMDAARNLTLCGLDIGERPSVVSAIIKYHLTEKYRQCINDAMDIQGGSGICLGPNNLIGRAYQAIPIAITVEGANILTRSMIIFGQGAIRAHPWVLKEFTAAQDPDRRRGLANFDQALFGHIRFLFGNLARSLFLGLSRGWLSARPVRGPLGRYYQQLRWMSSAFALCADVSMMTLGASLKRKERLSARLGDILSELYLGSAVLKRFEDEGQRTEDLPLAQWCLELSLYQMQEAFRSLFRNLPWRPLGWLLRLLVFPSGLPFTQPHDRLDHQVSGILLRPSEARDRLTRGIFSSDDPALREGQIELALRQADRVVAIEKTLREARHNGLIDARELLAQGEQALAQGLIDQQDLQSLQEMQRLRSTVIAVDSFEHWGKQHLLRKRSQGPANVHPIQEARHGHASKSY